MECQRERRHPRPVKRKPYRKSPPGPRPRHFIKEWRIHRGLTQEMLAARLGEASGASASNISQIENGKQGYTQAMLEALAEALMTDAASLIMRNPLDPEGIWTVWDTVPQTERSKAIDILKTLARTGTG